ncbi:alcohol dehydrogenase catalytic domain-containing protein [uncultured Muribaculum sp.]|uniref:alcohol dehydrogenase catalytic domain-containing protein n=1 Tax=uncultured Muribaculum sp. TaxID=1918613 RepID=UPI0026700CE0|nr:alcohol dehydrogenase catalytic domain-containing protein [uncultured Muribaculum sp.]
MKESMSVAVMNGIGKMELVVRPVPVPANGEVLVKIDYVGICGSDIHYYENGCIGNYIVKPPFVLGHEAAGEVVALGNGVTNLKIGDRVALEPGRTCGRCRYCREDNTTCARMWCSLPLLLWTVYFKNMPHIQPNCVSGFQKT